MGRITAIVLGSAAGGAFPQWNCRCPVCQLAWAGDPRVKPRTQAGLAVSAGDGRWTLINASPDLGAQIRATPALHPHGALRGTPIDAVVLTGGEIDQIAGLLSLRESAPFTLYATPASHAAVAANAMYGAMRAMTRRVVNPGERFMLSGGIEASLFMVPGKVPLYLEGDAPALNDESAANVGIELLRDGARLVFVPGAAAVTSSMSSCSTARCSPTMRCCVPAPARRRAAAWATCLLTVRTAPYRPCTRCARGASSSISTTPILS
jgi:pyrroloquinoline quinone biosynthesis protein B